MKRLPKKKNITSLRWRILFPMWWMLVLVLLAILIVSYFVTERYIHSCIEAEMESISTAARDLIEREYIYNEQLGIFQEDIYRLARRMVQSLNDLPRRIITTDYEIRFIVHTDELTLHFVTAEMAADDEETLVATEITNRMLAALTEEELAADERLSQLTIIDKMPYFAICMPLRLQHISGAENGYLISYVNTSSQSSILDSMNRGLAIIILVALIAAVVVSWYIAQRLSIPLKQLCEYAETIGRRDFRRSDVSSGILELDELTFKMNDMAEQLSEYEQNQKKFMLNISHDLRTPLTSIKGYAESICYEVADDPRLAADTILKESHHLEQMVENLLFMSRMDMAEDRFMFETLDLVQEVREVGERMQMQLAEKGLQLVYDLPACPVLVWADDMHLARVLMNIFSNALRYAESVITVRLVPEGTVAVVTIADDGPGFSEDDIKHLFDRFYKGRGGSFGVGMSIVKMVLEHMNGSVTAGNLPEGGAEVTVRLPLLENRKV